MKIVSKSVAVTKQFAREFVEKISKTAPPAVAAGGATIVGLYGNLGSGKTTFVQCVAEILGVAEHVTSPTFIIVKSYKLQVTSFKSLIHIDAYRLKSGVELSKLGFEELLHNPANIIIVEWADKVADILPLNHIKLRFEFINETTRKIIFD